MHTSRCSTSIELDTLIPLANHARYKMNPNSVVIVKYNINKLVATKFIWLIKEDTWLSPIVVVIMNNGKLRIYVDFQKLNAATKKIHTHCLL